MTAAASWEHAYDRFPREIEALLNASLDQSLVGLKLLAAIPEWEVVLEGGKTTSHTDVMALATNDSGLCVMAVEAKVDEAFGPSVGRKRAKASIGQHARLKYLCSVLNVPTLDDSVRYQLAHRTASAILTAREFHAQVAVMVVHGFGEKVCLRDDFDIFCTSLGAKNLPGGMRSVPSLIAPKLFLGWCNGDLRFCEEELPSGL